MTKTTWIGVLLPLCLLACDKSKGGDSKPEPAAGKPAPTSPTPPREAPPARPMPPPAEPAMKDPGPDPEGGNFTIEEATAGLPGKGKLMARITTPQGDMNCELFPDEAPTTVANFVGL